MRQTLEQQRAKYALDVVNEQKGKKSAEDYGRFVRRMPAMILNNGLGQALAFLLADGEAASKSLYDNIQDWLCGSGANSRPRMIYAKQDLIAELMEGSREQYIQAHQETLYLLSWMKKFVDAYLPKSEGI